MTNNIERLSSVKIREIRDQTPKTIYVKCIAGHEDIVGTEIEFEVLLTETVGALKTKIEREFGLESGILTDKIIFSKDQRQMTPRPLGNNDTTLRDNHIKNYTTITFGVEKNVGGLYIKQ